MSISMEKIDELRKRTNCSYEEAKNLLEKHDGDILESVVEFEKSNQFCHFNSSEHHHTFWQKLKAIFKKGFQTRFVITSNDETIINLSINFMILTALVAFHLMIVGLVLALILGYKIRIRKGKSTVFDVDKVIYNATEKVKSTAKSMTEDTESSKKDDNYNETTIE